jgi:hypothetical protein
VGTPAWRGDRPAAAHRPQPKGAALAGPNREGARPRAPQDVPSLQTTYSDHAIDKHARLREPRIAGTRSLPALGPAILYLFARSAQVPGNG